MILPIWLLGYVLSIAYCFPSNSFKSRHSIVLESYLFHHPSWEIRFYARHHDQFKDLIGNYRARGYNVTLIELNDTFLDGIGARIPEAKVWLDEREKCSSQSPYYNGHLVDLLKPSVLYLEGGVYSDLDALLLKPLPIDKWLAQAVDGNRGERCFAGQDLAFFRVGDACKWCGGAKKNVYIASGVIGAEPNSPIMREALRLGFVKGNYEPESFNQCGPKSFTLAMRKYPTKAVALSKSILYPFNYEEAYRLFSDHTLHLDVMTRESWSLHFFGGTTAKLEIEEGSVLDEAMRRFGLGDGGLKVGEYFEINGDGLIGSRVRAFNATRIDLSISDGGSITSGDIEANHIILNAENEASLNYLISACKINCASECKLSISTSSDQRELKVFDLNSILTIIIKTIGRMEKVIELVESIRSRYPTIKILVGDDGPDAHRFGSGDKRGFEYVPFEYDVGLSEGRNRLVRMVRTAYVQFLDDDFVFDAESDLGQLFYGLARFDVVGGKSHGDEVDYSGRIRAVWGNVNGERKRKLLITPTAKPKGFGPVQVDIIPNLFMAKTALFKEISWDPELRLAEHEDFFIRARQKGIRVAIHPQVSFNHHQATSPSPAYKALRDRWTHFASMMLRKHGFDELVSFGRSQISLNLLGKAQIKRLSTKLVMPFSAQLIWEPVKPFHRYKLQLLKDNSVVKEVLSRGCEHEFVDLEPNTFYQFKVFAGNHTDFSTHSSLLRLKTPSFFHKNLIKNPRFDGSTRSWKSSVGTVVALMPLYFPEIDKNVQGMICSGGTREHLIGRASWWAFKNGGSHLDRNYAAVLQIPVSLPSTHPTPYAIYQNIPISRVPTFCSDPSVECSMHASAWIKVDRIWGEESQILLDFFLEIERKDTKTEQLLFPFVWNQFDWQYGQINLPTLNQVDRIQSIKIGVRLGAPRGIVIVDDFYLSVRGNPI